MKYFWANPKQIIRFSGVDSGGAGGVGAHTGFGGLEKVQSLISAYRTLAISASNPRFEKLSAVLRFMIGLPHLLTRSGISRWLFLKDN